MNKIAYYKELIYKEAAIKAKKLVDAGKLSAQAVHRLYNEIEPVTQNIHNAINARAGRLAGKAWPKKMTSKNYPRVSKADSLLRRPAIDTKRQSKFQGKENAKNVGKIRKYLDQFGAKLDIQKNRSDFGGLSSITEDTADLSPTRLQIKLPKKDATMSGDPNLSKRVAKELRSYIAWHEISGEAPSQIKMNKLHRPGGILNKDATRPGINFQRSFRFGTHHSPLVLDNDAPVISSLSPEARLRIYLSKRQAQSGFTYLGRDLDENAVMNLARMKPGTRFNQNLDKPFFYSPQLSRDEKVNLLSNIANINSSSGPSSNLSASERRELATRLIDEPL